MGSAFPAEPWATPERHEEMVLVLYADVSDDPTVLHRSHTECDIECPHAMSVCGRFKAGGSHE